MNTLKRHAERGKRRVERLRVHRVCLNEKVKVPGVTRLLMKDHRETADDQISNAMGMEGGQKVFVVLVHPARSPNL